MSLLQKNIKFYNNGGKNEYINTWRRFNAKACNSQCKGSRLYYVTTAGGVIFNKVYGYGYIDFLARSVFGIQKVKCFTAENLDLDGADVTGILDRARAYIDSELANRG